MLAEARGVREPNLFTVVFRACTVNLYPVQFVKHDCYGHSSP